MTIGCVGDHGVDDHGADGGPMGRWVIMGWVGNTGQVEDQGVGGGP